MTFSVLQAVYRFDNPDFLEECFESLSVQTLMPNKIVLVEDGQLTNELEVVINKWKSKLPLTIVSYEENKGLAHALNYGIDFIETDYIARMDSDDYAYPDRFEKQIKYIEKYGIKICGTGIKEFYVDIKSNKTVFNNRFYPSDINLNLQELYKGTPLAHPTVMIETELLKKYKYSESTKMNEDIDLWFRLIKDGINIHNIQEPLVNFRITDSTFKRRSVKKAMNEFYIYFVNLYSMFGFSIKLLFPLLRLCSRFLPYRLNKFMYLSDIRSRLFSNKEHGKSNKYKNN